MAIVVLILGIVFFWFSIKLIYYVVCKFLLPPGHPRSFAARRERWQEEHPGRKYPFKH